MGLTMTARHNFIAGDRVRSRSVMAVLYGTVVDHDAEPNSVWVKFDNDPDASRLPFGLRRWPASDIGMHIEHASLKIGDFARSVNLAGAQVMEIVKDGQREIAVMSNSMRFFVADLLPIAHDTHTKSTISFSNGECILTGHAATMFSGFTFERTDELRHNTVTSKIEQAWRTVETGDIEWRAIPEHTPVIPPVFKRGDRVKYVGTQNPEIREGTRGRIITEGTDTVEVMFYMTIDVDFRTVHCSNLKHAE